MEGNQGPFTTLYLRPKTKEDKFEDDRWPIMGLFKSKKEILPANDLYTSADFKYIEWIILKEGQEGVVLPAKGPRKNLAHYVGEK